MKGKKKVDTEHEDALVTVLQRFGLFSKDWPNTLQNIAIKALPQRKLNMTSWKLLKKVNVNWSGNIC